MNYDGTPLWLADGLTGGDTRPPPWDESQLEYNLQALLVTAGQVNDSLAGLAGLLAADETLMAVNNQGAFDYHGLPLRTRQQLFQACALLTTYLSNELAQVAASLPSREAI